MMEHMPSMSSSPLSTERWWHHTPDQRLHRIARGLAITGLAVLLAACASAPKPPAAVDGQPPTAWQGRLAMTVDSQPPERMSASFTLQGSERAGSLDLFSPLGSTLARAEWGAQGATLTQGQDVRRFASLDAMLAQLASAALPVQALFDWLQGRPREVPGWHVDLSRQSDGRISATRQYPHPTVDLRLILD